MKQLRAIVSCLVIATAGMICVSHASSQIQIRLFTERRTRPHFVYYHHHRNWADRRDYGLDRRREIRHNDRQRSHYRPLERHENR
jgi:hypothetical protein